jgi:hypothetical protein
MRAFSPGKPNINHSVQSIDEMRAVLRPSGHQLEVLLAHLRGQPETH